MSDNPPAAQPYYKASGHALVYTTLASGLAIVLRQNRSDRHFHRTAKYPVLAFLLVRSYNYTDQTIRPTSIL